MYAMKIRRAMFVVKIYIIPELPECLAKENVKSDEKPSTFSSIRVYFIVKF